MLASLCCGSVTMLASLCCGSMTMLASLCCGSMTMAMADAAAFNNFKVEVAAHFLASLFSR
jgi:hypothetical protein